MPFHRLSGGGRRNGKERSPGRGGLTFMTWSRYIALFLINTLSAISAIVVGGLLIQALVSPSEIDTTGSLPITYGQPKINCRSDICINEKAEELHTLTVQMVENLLNDQIVMNRHLVTMSGSFFVIFSAVLAWNAIEFGIFLKVS